MIKETVMKFATAFDRNKVCETPLDEIHLEISWQLIYMNSELESWKNRFDDDPEYAFVYSDEAMDTATRFTLYAHLLSEMVKAEDDGYPAQVVLQNIADKIKSDLLSFNDFDASRTAGPYASIMGKRGYASAQFLKVLNSWINKLSK